jgi:diadenosine tetraphosphate (Ap4A) HIT family hydrolase
VGCFVAGYCLFMPVEHVDAAADLAAESLRHVEQSLERQRRLVESRFGPVIIAEHGSRDCALGSACCTHLHLHLIPVPDRDAVTAAYELAGGHGRPLTSLADLPAAVEGPYLYLSPRPGEHLLWPADRRFPRQFVRRVTADLHGAADRYDWRDHPFADIQRETLVRLRAATRLAAGIQ